MPGLVGDNKVSFLSDTIALVSNPEEPNLYELDINTGMLNLVQTDIEFATVIDGMVWASTPEQNMVILDPDDDYQIVREFGFMEFSNIIEVNIPTAGRFVLVMLFDQVFDIYDLNGTHLQSYNLRNIVIDATRWVLTLGPIVNSRGDIIFWSTTADNTNQGLIVIPAVTGPLLYDLDAAFVLTTNELRTNGSGVLPVIDSDDSFWTVNGRSLDHFSPDGEPLESFRLQMDLHRLESISPRGNFVFLYTDAEDELDWGLMLVNFPR
jgi:hypothetical protein